MDGRAANREQLTIDSLDGHAFLVRLKIAALLAIIDRRLNVTGEDWALAEIVMRTSDAVRRRTLDSVSAKAAKVEQASRDRHVRKEVGADRANISIGSSVEPAISCRWSKRPAARCCHRCPALHEALSR